MTSHDEDREEQLSDSEDLPSNRTEQHLTGISEVLNVRVALVELSDDISGVGSEETKTDDEDESWCQTQLGQSSWQGQNSQRNRLSNHNYINFISTYARFS